MDELPAQLDELCQTAALVVVRHPDKRDEVKAEIANILKVSLSTVQEHIDKRIARLSAIERQEPPRIL